MEETTVDTEGRIKIPEPVRKKWGIKEGTLIYFEEKDNEILLKPVAKKRVSLKDLCGLSPKRTGEPKWATAEEIKSIWEWIQTFWSLSLMHNILTIQKHWQTFCLIL